MSGETIGAYPTGMGGLTGSGLPGLTFPSGAAGDGATGGSTGISFPNGMGGTGSSTGGSSIGGLPTGGVAGSGTSSGGGLGGGGTGSGTGTSGQEDPPLDLEQLFDWQAAIAQTESDYQQAMTQSRDVFAAKLKNIHDVADAAAEARSATTATLQANSTAQLQAAIATIKASTEAANTARDQHLTELKNKLQTENAETEATYEQQTQAARGEKVATLGAVNQLFADKTRAVEDTFKALTDVAQQGLDASLSTVDSTYQSAIDVSNAAYDTAIQSADAAYDTTTQAAWDSLVSGAQAVSTSYEAALAAAVAARDAALAGTGPGSALGSSTASSATTGSGSTGSGSTGTGAGSAQVAYEAAVAAAQATFTDAITALVDAYRAAMTTARTSYETAMTTANTAYNGAITIANDKYTTATKNAFDAYNTKVDKAVQDFDGQVKQLQIDFDKTVKAASAAYDTSITKANTDYEKALVDAQKAYDDLVNPVQTAFGKFRDEEPGKLATAIANAAKAWATAVRSAVSSAPATISGANVSHGGSILGAIAGLADMDPTIMSGKLTLVMQEVNKAAVKANKIYIATISAPLNMPTTTMAEAEAAGIARMARDRAAVVTYLDSVVGKLVSEAGKLKGDYETAVKQTYADIDKAIEDAAKADENMTNTVNGAYVAIQRAKEAGYASYMQQLATLQEAYITAAENNAISLRNAVTTGTDRREKAKASAAAARSIAKSAAAKAYVDKVADAEKTYVDSYADDWKVMRKEFTDAAQKLVEKLTDADNDWVAAANTADEGWVTASKAAAASYNTAAATAYETAHTSAHTAVTAYDAAVRPAWEASIRANYANPADADPYLAAWGGYTDAVIAAWVSADSALTSLDNSYADTVSNASNTQLTATATAAHTAASAEVSAAATAAIAATDARRTYDTSYTNAAVTRAKELVAGETTKAKDTVAAEQKENDKLAAEYEIAVTKANDSHEAAVTGANNEIKDATNQFTADSFKIAFDLQKSAEQAANDAADAAIAEVKTEAEALKDRLIAATKKHTAQRAAEMIKGFGLAIAAIGKKMSDIKADPNLSLNQYQMAAASAAIPFGSMEVSTVLSLDFFRTTLRDTAFGTRAGMLQAAAMAVAGMGTTSMASGPDASSLMRQLLGLSTLRVGISNGGGVYIGQYDPLDGMVYRNVPNSSGGRKSSQRSLAIVESQLQTPVGIAFKDRDWDGFFGGYGGSSAPDPKSYIHIAMNYFVDDDKLAAPGGLASDILIAAEVGFQIAGLVDPIGIADAGGGAIQLLQGDYTGAAISFGSIAVPFGAEKIAKAVSRIPTGALDDAVKGIGDLAITAKGNINKSLGFIDDAGAARSSLIGKTRLPIGIKQNKAAGDAWESELLNKILPKSQSDIKPQITIKSNGPSAKKVRVDSVGTDNGTGGLRLSDGKASDTAGLTPNQTVVYPELESHGGMVVGKGKPPYIGGTHIPPTRVDIIRPGNK